ncbi:hypothetical protein ACFL6C_05340 [Myxococcota bacterium]
MRNANRLVDQAGFVANTLALVTVACTARTGLVDPDLEATLHLHSQQPLDFGVLAVGNSTSQLVNIAHEGGEAAVLSPSVNSDQFQFHGAVILAPMDRAAC